MEKNKVTSEVLRLMEIGQTITFDLPDARAINTAKSLAYRIQHELGCKFCISTDYEYNRLRITKLPRP